MSSLGEIGSSAHTVVVPSRPRRLGMDELLSQVRHPCPPAFGSKVLRCSERGTVCGARRSRKWFFERSFLKVVPLGGFTASQTRRQSRRVVAPRAAQASPLAVSLETEDDRGVSVRMDVPSRDGLPASPDARGSPHVDHYPKSSQHSKDGFD